MQRILLSSVAVLALTSGAMALDLTKGPSPMTVAQAPSENAPQNQKMPDSEKAARSFTEEATGQVQRTTDGRAALENGVLQGGSPDSETAPAKFSEKNAEADRGAIMARPLPLTDEQRQKIYARVMESGQKAETNVKAEPSTILPSTVVLHELPQGVVDEAPVLRGFKFVRLEDRVIIVSPPTRGVVGEFTGDKQAPR